VIHFLEIDFAIRAGVAGILAASRLQFPAGNRKIEDCGALPADVFSTSPDAPARCDGQKLLDTGDVEPFLRKQLPKAFQPLEVVVGIKSLSTSPCGLDQSFLFVDPECPRMNIQEFSHNPNRIERFLPFEFHVRTLLYRTYTKSVEDWAIIKVV